MKYFYEKNIEILNHEINKNFEEVLWMNDSEFCAWVSDFRKVISNVWDEKGIPPVVGYNEEDIISQFNQLEKFAVHEFVTKDLLLNENNVIRNTSIVGNAVNSWFPTMMATKINYTKDVNAGLSIYDHFKLDSLYEKVVTYARRHFKRDSFYHYSKPVRKGDTSLGILSTDAITWINEFEQKIRQYGKYDYWLEPTSDDESANYTGYNEDLKNVKFLKLSFSDYEKISDSIPTGCKSNIEIKKGNSYQIRLFELGQKIFPLGFKAFKVSWCQYAHNFPPLTAKFLYEKYTEEFRSEDKIYIWDPSCGWGGRILGAMSVCQDRNIHYIGTDPNTDHNTTPGRTKYHEVADYYNNKTSRKKGLLDVVINTYEIHQCGSEVFHLTEAFQQYKNKVSVVFTSPPYFAKEAYSQDETQSYKKFSQYESWRDGFLVQTIHNAFDILRPGGYLLWNIADAWFGNEMLPLEQDSIDIAQKLGLEHIFTWKMALAQMPGGNRIDPDTGLPMSKNFCKINAAGGKKALWLKYEPVFVFKKC